MTLLAQRRFRAERLCPRLAAVAIAMVVALAAARANSEPIAVVVRDDGAASLVIDRLQGQLADLEVMMTFARGPIEPAREGQLAAAARLAETHDARAVVWFVARSGGLTVAVATPRDRHLFVREIPAADASAVAEAAAVAVRGAVRALAEGGTIGVEVDLPVLPAPAPVAPAPRRFGLELAIGWQVALDAGADAGAHAIAQRTSLAYGPWAMGLALAFGPALRSEVRPDITVELSRSDAMLGVERRFGGFALGASAGAILYRRATLAAPTGLAATPAATTAAFVAGPALRWGWRPGGGHVGIEAVAGLDVVLGAPELAVVRGEEVETLGELRMLQPRFGLSIIAGLP